MDITMSLWNKVSVLTEAQAAGGSGHIDPEQIICKGWEFQKTDDGLVHPQRANIEVGHTYKLLDTKTGEELTGVAELSVDAYGNSGIMVVFGGYLMLAVLPQEQAEKYGIGTFMSYIGEGTVDFPKSLTVDIIRAETTHPINPKFLPDGGVGYIEPGKVYTYDGNPDVVEQVTIGELRTTAAYIVSNAPHLDSIVSVTATAMNGTQLTATAEEMQLSTYGGAEMLTYQLAGYGTLPVAFWSNGELYAFYSADIGYCSRIEFAETIRTIDPKFLPQSSGNNAAGATNDFMVSLPRVILSDDVDNITTAESNLLEAAWETGLPCIIECRDWENNGRKCVCATRVQPDGDYAEFRLGCGEWPKVRRLSSGKWAYQWGGEA